MQIYKKKCFIKYYMIKKDSILQIFFEKATEMYIQRYSDSAEQFVSLEISRLLYTTKAFKIEII